MSGRVAWITIAPVKGLGLVSLDAVDLGPDGVVENRRFHVVDERGRLVNGKRFGPLVQVRPAWDETSRRLVLRFPDGCEVAGEVELGAPAVTVFYGRPVPGQLVEGPWSEALSEFAGAPLKLIQPRWAGAAIDRGADNSVSLLSVAAVQALGLDPRRFRMLFGVDGIPAHAEDDWVGYRVRIGDAVVRPQGHTGRCLITSQDPDTGRPDVDTLQMIRDTRPNDTSEPLPFGVHGTVAEPGRVRVGDPVERL